MSFFYKLGNAQVLRDLGIASGVNAGANALIYGAEGLMGMGPRDMSTGEYAARGALKGAITGPMYLAGLQGGKALGNRFADKHNLDYLQRPIAQGVAQMGGLAVARPLSEGIGRVVAGV